MADSEAEHHSASLPAGTTANSSVNPKDVTVGNEMAAVECFRLSVAAFTAKTPNQDQECWKPPAHPCIAQWRPRILIERSTLNK